MITETERKYLLNSMMKLLDEYDYNYTLHALNSIIDEWEEQKSDLIEAFKKHPNYVDGKFMIAFSSNYERITDLDAVKKFSRYIQDVIVRMLNDVPDEMKEQRKREYCAYLPNKLWNFLAYLYEYINDRTISEETAKYLEETIPQIHPHTGEKSSRVVNRVCTYLGYHKDKDYNREFAKFADALSPMTIKRHTVLSINPLDYLTMSFGNSWASCHTIDKRNKRDMPDSYEGQYSSGTVSYMLDRTSMVFYTVDEKYDGDEYWTQSKINRQMFHYGEDKLVQGRLYPQDNDYNGSSLYTQYRNVVQSIVSLIFDFPNLWSLEKGTSAASRYINSEGTHYEDYCHYDKCSLSKRKDIDNRKSFIVGAMPICVQCGERHEYEESINHCDEGRVCQGCGRIIRDEDDEYWVGDTCYCRDCVTYCECCDEYVYHEDAAYSDRVGHYICPYCRANYYTYCNICGEYEYNDDAQYIESEDRYVCHECLEEYYEECAKCGEYHDKKTMFRDGESNYYCEECENEMEDDE